MPDVAIQSESEASATANTAMMTVIMIDVIRGGRERETRVGSRDAARM